MRMGNAFGWKSRRRRGYSACCRPCYRGFFSFSLWTGSPFAIWLGTEGILARGFIRETVERVALEALAKEAGACRARGRLPQTRADPVLRRATSAAPSGMTQAYRLPGSSPWPKPKSGDPYFYLRYPNKLAIRVRNRNTLSPKGPTEGSVIFAMKAGKVSRDVTVGIFSSSSPVSATAPVRYLREKEYLASKGIRVVDGNLYGKRDFYRAGSIQARAAEFNELLYRDDVQILMASVGGNNTNPILPYIDYEYVKGHP